jgi:undecaprenyl-phosphate 4-deoxy-4-formamido-L-arabinose transferase
VIRRLCRSHSHIVGIDLRRNFGQNNAILEGLRYARGRYVAIMDDDLQHHPRDLPKLIARLDEGPDVVYGQFQIKHQKVWKNLGSWFNGISAQWLINKPKGLYLSAFKVLRRSVARRVCKHVGPDPYVDALILQVTSRVAQVVVDHQPRYGGTSTYTFTKCLRVWARLTFACSVKPLRVLLGSAFTLIAVGVGAMLWGVLNWDESAGRAPTEAILLGINLVLTSVELAGIGIVGEYVGRIHRTVSGTPQAITRRVIDRRGESRERNAA